MSKQQRIAEFARQTAAGSDESLDARYAAYFTCFNSQRYYEAHDVLEHLWLEEQGPNRDFFKGLIQFAGAFVHLKLQYEHASHPKHGRRLHPAARLFQRAIAHVEHFPEKHWRLDVVEVCRLARCYVHALENGRFEKNPWHPEHAPKLHLLKSENG